MVSVERGFRQVEALKRDLLHRFYSLLLLSSFSPFCFHHFFVWHKQSHCVKKEKRKKKKRNSLTTILQPLKWFSKGILQLVLPDKRREHKKKKKKPLKRDPSSFLLRRQRMHVNANGVSLHKQTRSNKRPYSLTSEVAKISFYLCFFLSC